MQPSVATAASRPHIVSQRCAHMEQHGTGHCMAHRSKPQHASRTMATLGSGAGKLQWFKLGDAASAWHKYLARLASSCLYTSSVLSVWGGRGSNPPQLSMQQQAAQQAVQLYGYELERQQCSGFVALHTLALSYPVTTQGQPSAPGELFPSMSVKTLITAAEPSCKHTGGTNPAISLTQAQPGPCPFS